MLKRIRNKSFCILVASFLCVPLNQTVIFSKSPSDHQSENDYTIVDETTLKNTETNELIMFENIDERDNFLSEILFNDEDISAYACLPGDPGYPTCSGAHVVSTTLQTFSSTTTGYMLSKNYLCGDNGWVFYPGTAVYSKTSAVSAQYTYKGTFTLSFSYSVTVGASFKVSKGYKGNFKYKGKFKLTPKRYIYKLSDGSTVYGTKFYTRQLLAGSGIQPVELKA